jgi:hypothetical protein
MRVRLLDRETRQDVAAYEVEGRPGFQQLVAECTARGYGLLWWRDGRPGEIICQVTKNREGQAPRPDSGQERAKAGGEA